MINYPYIYDNNNKWISFEDNFNNIILTGSYIGQYEIIKTCIENRGNIIFYRRDNISFDKKNYLYKYETLISDNENFNPFITTIIIGWANDNHYELLMPIGLTIEEYPIEYKFSNNFWKNNKIIANRYNSSYSNSDNKNEKTNLLNNNIPDNSITSNRKNKNLAENYKEELTNFVKNPKSIYPIIRGNKYGETVLEDIYNFLLSNNKYHSRESKSKKWPQYIIDAEAKIKNIKKTNSDKKQNSNIEDNIPDIKNLKTGFRKKANNYFINDNNELFYKNKIKYKVNNKIITKIENFKVPTVKELNNLLYEYHTKTCHANYKELKNCFYTDKIGFKGIDYLVQEYINNCPVCEKHHVLFID